MSTLDRCRVLIAGGGVVGPAAMNFYFAGITSTDLTAVKTFITALNADIPSTQTYTVPSSGDTIVAETGKLSTSWSVGTPQTVTGGSVDSHTGQAGGLIRWKTIAVVDGHRPVGRAIFVPLTRSVFTPSGAMTTAWQTKAQTAANAFLSSSVNFRVWHRPKYNYATKPGVLVRPGSIVAVAVADVSLITATLRSRNH